MLLLLFALLGSQRLSSLSCETLRDERYLYARAGSEHNLPRAGNNLITILVSFRANCMGEAIYKQLSQ